MSAAEATKNTLGHENDDKCDTMMEHKNDSDKGSDQELSKTNVKFLS